MTMIDHEVEPADLDRWVANGAPANAAQLRAWKEGVLYRLEGEPRPERWKTAEQGWDAMDEALKSKRFRCSSCGAVHPHGASSGLSPEVIAAARAACEMFPQYEADESLSCLEEWPFESDPNVDDWCDGCLRAVGVKVTFYVKGEGS